MDSSTIKRIFGAGTGPERLATQTSGGGTEFENLDITMPNWKQFSERAESLADDLAIGWFRDYILRTASDLSQENEGAALDDLVSGAIKHAAMLIDQYEKNTGKYMRPSSLEEINIIDATKDWIRRYVDYIRANKGREWLGTDTELLTKAKALLSPEEQRLINDEDWLRRAAELQQKHTYLDEAARELAAEMKRTIKTAVVPSPFGPGL